MSAAVRTDRPLLVAGGLLGFGLGGLLDVLLFHFVLQTHHLLSGIYPPTTMEALRFNLVADGLFSIGMILVMTVGFVLTWRALTRAGAEARSSGGAYAGAVVVGIALFNLYDGIVDHYILGLHHATTPRLDIYDVVWVVASLVLLAAGLLVLRAERHASAG
jgi:uncharacterized membrane protein